MLKQLDQNLLNLAWSLWTELGVAGVKQHHQNVVIQIEELIIFTSVLAERDPRLRDESMDWIAKYPHFISISRLKFLLKTFEDPVLESFSKYATTINSVSGTKWPIVIKTNPLPLVLSRKSSLPCSLSPALLNIRARSLFGPGARADLITHFITHLDEKFSASELTKIGYSKRNLAEILEVLSLGNLIEKSVQGNLYRYRLPTNSPLFFLLQPVSAEARPWSQIFRLLLTVRECVQRTESYPDIAKMVEFRNCLDKEERVLQMLRLNPPSFEKNAFVYLQSFSEWVLEWTNFLANG